MQLAELDDLDVLQQLVLAGLAGSAQQDAAFEVDAALEHRDDDGDAQDDPDNLHQLAAIAQAAPRRAHAPMAVVRARTLDQGQEGRGGEARGRAKKNQTGENQVGSGGIFVPLHWQGFGVYGHNTRQHRADGRLTPSHCLQPNAERPGHAHGQLVPQQDHARSLQVLRDIAARWG